MAYQTVFKRYELKYMLSPEQKQKVLEAMAGHMALDDYGRTTIRNLYYDTDNYRLIRRSLDRPEYKEKLRVRSYARAGKDDTVFVELKKKYDSVVYKRRLSLPQAQAMAWTQGDRASAPDSQIAREIDYVLSYYRELKPKVFLSYEREAYFSTDGCDLRLTLDENILCRQSELSLDSEAYGTPLLEKGQTLMEIKCAGAIPLYLVRVLSKEHIYKTSYSKYGTAYETIIFPKIEEGMRYA